MNLPAAEKQIELSIVMPCLNERESVGVQIVCGSFFLSIPGFRRCA
jgi:hypothetical protein